MCGYSKSKVYAQKSQNIDDLQYKVHEEFAIKPLNLIHRVVQNIRGRLKSAREDMAVILGA